jgi:GGDEF domain-containing protein
MRVALAGIDFVDDEMLDTLIVPRGRLDKIKQISFNLGVASIPENIDKKYKFSDLLNEAQDALKLAIRSGKDKTATMKKLQ